MRLGVILTLICFLAAAAAEAQAPGTPAPDNAGEEWLISHLSGFLRHGVKTGEIRRQLEQQFRAADILGEGISSRTRTLAIQKAYAQSRSLRIAEWARWDLDGDGKVTKEEVADARSSELANLFRFNSTQLAPTPEQRKEALDKLVAQSMEMDRNKDGVITLDEVIEAHQQQISRDVRRTWIGSIAIAMPDALDANGDGTISLQEYMSAVDKILARIDQDNDGTLSAEEIGRFRTTLNAAQESQRRRDEQRQFQEVAKARAAECALPQPTADATVLLIGAYAGNAISTVSLGDDAVEATVVDLVIEVGPKPLYVIATSPAAVIWRLSGDVKRVRQLVAATDLPLFEGKRPRSGVIGLTETAVHFVTRADCFANLPESTMGREHAERLKTIALKELLGRNPDIVLDSNMGNLWTTISRYDLPSGGRDFDGGYPGARQLPVDGASAEIWRDVRRIARGGVVEIDAASVVSPVPVGRYQVLPGAAGIAQLVDEGVLEPVEWRDGFRDGDRTQIGGPRDKMGQPGHFKAPLGFRIVKPMRFPGGNLSLFAIGDPRFILARGVPSPTGNAGRACVVSEETGQVLMGEPSRRCR